MAGVRLKAGGVYNFSSNAGNTKLQLNFGTTFPYGLTADDTITIKGGHHATSPLTLLTVEGNIEADADVIAFSTSDQRLKDNIFIIEDPLEKINALKGVTFNWNDKAPAWTRKDKWQSKDKRDVGVIAQDVIKVLPEAVNHRTGDEKYLAVDYKKLVPLLIESVKDLDKKIKMLENKLDKLTTK